MPERAGYTLQLKWSFLQSLGRLTESFLELPIISGQKRYYFSHHLSKQTKQKKEKSTQPKKVITITYEREEKVQRKGFAQMASPLLTVFF